MTKRGKKKLPRMNYLLPTIGRQSDFIAYLQGLPLEHEVVGHNLTLVLPY